MNNKIIYSVSSKGKITTWEASLNYTPNSEGYLEITITSGYEDGKKVDRIREVKSGKNIGRANETSLEQQAELELERLYQDKYDKGYVDDRESVSTEKKVNNIRKPMTAHKYPDKAHKLPQSASKIVFQPKIDGLRCLITKTEDDVTFSSRSGKLFNTIPHLKDAVKDVLSVGDVLDGELYIHGKELQEIMSIVSPSKNIKEEALKDIKLYWYDSIPSGKESDSYENRFINSDFDLKDPIIKIETFIFDSEVDKDSDEFLTKLESTFDKYLKDGYEGLMIRNTEKPYYFGRRHESLQKYKKMFSDEFKIIDILESDNDEAPRFVCDLGNENTVTVRLKGDKEENTKYLENKEDYIGKWLTINYQTWTKTGSLQFPVGVAIREGEEIDGKFVPSI